MEEKEKPRRTAQLPVVLYPSELERYRRASRKQGVRLSDWVRDALNTAAAREHVRAEDRE